MMKQVVFYANTKHNKTVFGKSFSFGEALCLTKAEKKEEGKRLSRIILKRRKYGVTCKGKMAERKEEEKFEMDKSFQQFNTDGGLS